ncbi:hypothetical protein VNI00_003764 [Paramarasmius palmivorus]|uniref:Uncharacterized protein n=1 Tax=Paramarasmius palmivorus TaxID=297713 RepID=A0AAW0DP80_9AGAR
MTYSPSSRDAAIASDPEWSLLALPMANRPFEEEDWLLMKTFLLPDVDTISPVTDGTDAEASAESEEVITVAGDDSCSSDDQRHASCSPSPGSSDESEIDELFDDDDENDEETRTSLATTLGSDVIGVLSREEEVPASDDEEGSTQGSRYYNSPPIHSSPRCTSYLRPSLPPNYNDEVVPESPTLTPQSPLFTPPSSPFSLRHSRDYSAPRNHDFGWSSSLSACEEEEDGCHSPLFTPPSSPQKREPVQLIVNQGNDHGEHQRACSRSSSPVVNNGDEDSMIVDEVDDECKVGQETHPGSIDSTDIVPYDQRNNLHGDGIDPGARHYTKSIPLQEFEWDNRDGSITATGSNGSGPCDDDYELCYPSEASGGEHEEHEECATIANDLLKTKLDSDVSSAHRDQPNTSPPSFRAHASLPPDITHLPPSSPLPELVDASFPRTFTYFPTVSGSHKHSDIPTPNESSEEGELHERQPLSTINLPSAPDTPSPSPPPKPKPIKDLSVQITPIPTSALPSAPSLISPSTSTNGTRFILKITEPKRKRKRARKSKLESAPPAKKQRVQGSLPFASAPLATTSSVAGPSTTPVHSPTATRILFEPPVAAPRPRIPSKTIPVLEPRVLHEKDITDCIVIGWANDLRDKSYVFDSFMAEQTHGQNITVVLNEIEAWKHTLVPSLRKQMRARRTQKGLLNRGMPMQVERLVQMLYKYKDKTDWGMVIQQKVVGLLEYFWEKVPGMTVGSWDTC